MEQEGVVMGYVLPDRVALYTPFIDLASTFPEYYRHKICGTRNRSQYLKIVARKGMMYTSDHLLLLESLGVKLSEERGCTITFNHNAGKGTVTITQG